MDKKPVYLLFGFLEAGKTAFIKDTLLSEYFKDGAKTLIVACEDGEEEYDKKFLDESNSVVAYISEQADFTAPQLESLLKESKADRVFLEYNGMWPVSLLSQELEAAQWEIAQTIMIADGGTFDLYLGTGDLRAMAVEMFRVSELVIFNRCKTESPRATYRRVARAANPRLQVAFEMADGEEPGEDDDVPYDLNAPVIEIEDSDYAIFHVDAMEKGERYLNKTVHFKAQFCKPRFGATKGTFIPGRFAMVCCANDIQFIGYLAQADPFLIKGLENRDWIEVTAKVGYERRREYQGVGPVFSVTKLNRCTKPQDEVCYF